MKTPQAISAWLVDYLAKLLDLDPSQIDPNTFIGDYGLDSAGAAGLSGDLSDWLGVQLEESVAFDHPTIEQLSKYVSECVQTD